MRLILDRLRKYNLYVKLLKYEFFKKEVDFFRYYIEIVGILIDPRKVKTIYN